jgi:Holliday junction resolvase RusA-like endonuclease
MDWPDISIFDAYYFFEVEPVAASRPRIRVVGKGQTMAYYVGKYKDFKENVAPDIVKLCVAKHFDKGTPLCVWVSFCPKKPKTSKLDYPNPDIDNYLKAIFDVLNGELWHDDKQIVEVHANKEWSKDESYLIFGVKAL